MPRPRIKESPKPCKRCGIKFTRKRYNGVLEDMSTFKRRRFCTLHCANLRGNWGQSSTAKHRAARKYFQPQCEKCGKSNTLHVHHRDENYKNNHKRNLQTLCASCHRLRHSFL